MNWTQTKIGYAASAILMHWLTLILIVAGYALMELKSFVPRGSELRLNMAIVHYLLGLIVFGLVWVRLVVRLAKPAPLIEPPPAAWETALAKAMHGLLYAFMIALPLLGWLALSANGKPVHLFVFDLPFPIEPDKDLAKQLKQWHQWIANAGYFAIGLHATAALYHHYLRRDNTLKRMLPRQWR